MKKILLVSILTLIFTNCSSSKKEETLSEGETLYKVSVSFNWTKTNHPDSFGDFPSNAHFSPLVVSTHKQEESVYTRGEPASAGIKQMAETGNTSLISSEIEAQINEKKALGKLIGSVAKAKEDKDFGNIKASDNFHYLSVVSMIAPSPDWFIAKRNINLKSDDGKSWQKTIKIDLLNYDSGTDSGDKFTSPNSETNPKENVSLLTNDQDIVLATLTLTRE